MTPLVLLLLLGVVSASPPTEVIVLTDSTFEHDTQAATGQTTGIWCVLFTSSKSRVQHQDALAVWSELAADEEKEVIYAMVDLDSSKKVAQRFKDVQVPSAVLLRNRAMYTYAVPDSDDCHEHIIGFVSSGYTLLPRQTVPPESAGSLGQADAPFELDEENARKLKWALIMLGVGIFWKVFVIFHKPAAPAAEAAKQEAVQPTTKKPAPASGKAKKGSKRGDSVAAGTPAKKDK